MYLLFLTVLLLYNFFTAQNQLFDFNILIIFYYFELVILAASFFLLVENKESK